MVDAVKLQTINILDKKISYSVINYYTSLQADEIFCMDLYVLEGLSHAFQSALNAVNLQFKYSVVFQALCLLIWA